MTMCGRTEKATKREKENKAVSMCLQRFALPASFQTNQLNSLDRTFLTPECGQFGRKLPIRHPKNQTLFIIQTKALKLTSQDSQKKFFPHLDHLLFWLFHNLKTVELQKPAGRLS
ncbi:hypothetical protein ACP90_07840 [Labrenzia sp. CP4]|nr:hypothetical protein ACP90_07840 [Labrenzia sp. CP4]